MQKAILRSTEFSRQPDEGITSGVAYDTAWTARVTDQGGKSLFPECIQWLLENQKPDGSWGGQILSYHDRIISTLSALVALKEIGRERYNDYIQRGENYIWKNLKNIEMDQCRFIGSELLLPSLMLQAESMGLDLPYNMKVYEKEYQKKLSKVEESLWYSPATPLSFSLEFLGSDVDVDRLSHVQLSNGSVATAPAATAFLLRHKKDPKAFRYLKEILSITGDGSVMTVFPIEVFEYSWNMYNLMLAGLYFERYTEICDYLLSHLQRSNLCWSTDSPVSSADETVVVCKVLHDLHYPVDPRVLDEYDTGYYYVTLNFELDPSVSTNIHILDFVRSYSEFPHRDEVLERLIRFLKSEMNSAGFWVDKWHASPYYPTSHAVIALCDVDPSLAEKAVSWILKSQNSNGLWGMNNGTLEETAYAVQALIYYHQKVDHIDISNILESLKYLNGAILAPSSSFPELWIGKVQYTPTNVVWSAIISARMMLNSFERLRASPRG